jgi:uncharacterized protein (DUF885 family)
MLMAKKTPKQETPAPAPRPADTSSVRRFQDLVTRYYEESFARFPTLGSAAGRHEFDAEMGRTDPATLAAQYELATATLAEIEDLPLQDFRGADLLDRRVMLANLRQEKLDYDLERHRNDPQNYLHGAADALYDLFVRHASDLRPVAPAIISRLKQIPRYLDEAAENLAKPDPLWKELTLKAASAVAGFFETLPEPLAQAGGGTLPALKRHAKHAAEAALDFAARVKKLRPAPAGSYALGTEKFTLLMHERTGLDCSPREAAAMGRRLAAELKDAMIQEARKFHPTRSADEILADAAAEWQPDGGSLIDAYRRTMQTTRERFEEADWLSFPKKDRLLVQPVPDFMRDQFPTAAYSSPGALDPDQTGIFWVNDLSLTAGTEEKRRAEVSQHFGLELTCAHEAYPGHHLQFVTQHRIPSLPRKMAHHAIYYEGWTLWCEQMTTDLGFPENPYLRLIQLHDALWRAWRIVIDVGLHTGELSYAAACDVLVSEVGFTRTRAQGDVNWYTSSPTVPMSYLLGKMELLRLKHQRVDRGNMSLREFNDWVLSFGAIPWRWIEASGL